MKDCKWTEHTRRIQLMWEPSFARSCLVLEMFSELMNYMELHATARVIPSALITFRFYPLFKRLNLHAPSGLALSLRFRVADREPETKYARDRTRVNGATNNYR
ncbi:hypothetical protein AB6A40_010490 [Gnathostoma spinigerum]|uniref:Uncharacterized protein n=1 Tax=Gnathostoma spinigerum TaxID=75299 RepID=A0ABD6EV70_9BILA